MERSSEARFCRFCLARAVRQPLSRAVRPLPTGGTTFDEAGGVDALSPELAALRPYSWQRSGAVEDTHRGARFGHGIGARDGAPIAATAAGDSGA